MRQLVTESLVLAIIGGGAGLLVAAWGLDLLLAAGLARIPRAEAIGIDRRVLGFTLGVSVLTGLFFSLAPALGAARLDPGQWLRAGRADYRNTLCRARELLSFLTGARRAGLL